MTKFNVTLNLVVEADNVSDAVDLGFSMCEHLCDTFNDNESISPLVSVEAKAVEACDPPRHSRLAGPVQPMSVDIRRPALVGADSSERAGQRSRSRFPAPRCSHLHLRQERPHMKRTNWYPPTVLPVREGVYECEWTEENWLGGLWYNYWDGKQFLVGNLEVQAAADTRHRVPCPMRQLKRWRGVCK